MQESMIEKHGVNRPTNMGTIKDRISKGGYIINRNN